MNNLTTAQQYTLSYITPELVTRWASYIDASERTIDTYTKGVKQFFIFIFDRNITQPQREDVITYRDYLLTTHKPTTVQIYLESVKIFFRWTAQEGLYPNIADRVKGVRLDKEHKKDYLTTAQVKRLLSSIDRTTVQGLRDYAILSLMVTTGLRTISIINANIEDIRTAGDSTALYYKGKGHNEKAIYVKLAPPVEDAIRDYMSTRKGTSASDPLFTSEAHRNTGERLTTRSIRRIVKTRFLNVGLNSDRITAHSLRHTAGTLNLLNGGTLEETRQLLDHSNINTTLIYSHALERANNNSEQRIANAIF